MRSVPSSASQKVFALFTSFESTGVAETRHIDRYRAGNGLRHTSIASS